MPSHNRIFKTITVINIYGFKYDISLERVFTLIHINVCCVIFIYTIYGTLRFLNIYSRHT